MGRLQKIKQETGREYLNTNLSPIIDFKYEDIKWLIEQAEKAEEYKDAIENLEGELSRGYPY